MSQKKQRDMRQPSGSKTESPARTPRQEADLPLGSCPLVSPLLAVVPEAVTPDLCLLTLTSAPLIASRWVIGRYPGRAYRHAGIHAVVGCLQGSYAVQPSQRKNVRPTPTQKSHKPRASAEVWSHPGRVSADGLLRKCAVANIYRCSRRLLRSPNANRGSQVSRERHTASKR